MSPVGRVLDTLVWRKGETAWVEIKVPGSRARWTYDQLKFIAYTKFNIVVAKDGPGALYALRTKTYLTQKQKDAIAVLILLNKKKLYLPSEVDPIIQPIQETQETQGAITHVNETISQEQ